mmetsp:Transcript_14070/g.37858  ORF Transcript_14070/g.37858 Transcript_14070/m.37858 type:complete len:106 (-) Transcript_14070:471-788(-)
MVKQLATKAEFDAELAAAGGTLVVVDFTATWCGPCKMISPVLEQMAKEHSDIIVVKVDVDENSETAEACGITAMPTFQFFKNGSKISEFKGANGDKLKDTIKSLK